MQFAPLQFYWFIVFYFYLTGDLLFVNYSNKINLKVIFSIKLTLL